MSRHDELARLVRRPERLQAFHRGVVTAVQSGDKTATVNYAGAVITMPYLSHLTIAVDDHVDILLVGAAPRIVGVSQ